MGNPPHAPAASAQPRDRFLAVFEQSPVAQALVSTDGTITAVNLATRALLGPDAAEVVGQPLLAHVPPEEREHDAQRLSAVLSGRRERAQFTRRLRREDHQSVDALVSVAAVKDAGGNVVEVAVSLQDVSGLATSQRRAERAQALHRAALEDPLTQLPNRALLLDSVAQAVEDGRATGRPYALVFLDIDRLKAINDAFGHGVGDRALQRVAEMLREVARPTDTIGRWGSDTFAVLLVDLERPGEAEQIAQHVVTSLTTALEVDASGPVQLSACVGLAHGPAASAEALVAAAEAAAARAKELGRGRLHVLEDRVRDRLTDQRALGGELMTAVAQRRLAVHYQPIVELRTGRITSFEALVRWPHADRGLVGPDEFLPLAEALDLQVQIDDWVVHAACAAARAWADAVPHPVSVAVNVSPAQLTSPGFAQSVRSALASTGLSPSLLDLEVTETAVVADMPLAQQVLATLRELGVRVSIDDFGTGYASMLQLRQLPFQTLKIDREFVSGLPHSADDMAICASLIGLADRLGVRTVGEGVEDSDQAEALAALGCRLGQGFWWSRAVPSHDALALLQRDPWSRGAPPQAGVAAEVLSRAQALYASGTSLHTIAAVLNRDGLRTDAGRRWHAASVARMLRRRPDPG